MSFTDINTQTELTINNLGLDQHNSHKAWVKKASKNVDQLMSILEKRGNYLMTAQRLMDLEWKHFNHALNCEGIHVNCAIDAVLLVCRRLKQEDVLFYPSIMTKLKEVNPGAFEFHLKRIVRHLEISLKENISEGQHQGFYRNDLSSELLSRLFLSRFLDLYNPGAFNPEDYNYKNLYQSIIHSFINGILTEKGISYYESLLTEKER
ncbi:MAG: hypothetical protein JEZ03_11845 [Bacteroidales bacterium]|nr:hypothetical protein [Bacteroidales bacterium]